MCPPEKDTDPTAAELIARMILQECGVSIRPGQVHYLIRTRWDSLAKLAHSLHEKIKLADARTSQANTAFNHVPKPPPYTFSGESTNAGRGEIKAAQESEPNPEIVLKRVFTEVLTYNGASVGRISEAGATSIINSLRGMGFKIVKETR